MASIEINIDAEWMKSKGACELCDNCGDVIVADKNEMYLFVADKLVDKPQMVLCDGCYELIKEKI